MALREYIASLSPGEAEQARREGYAMTKQRTPVLPQLHRVEPPENVVAEKAPNRSAAIWWERWSKGK